MTVEIATVRAAGLDATGLTAASFGSETFDADEAASGPVSPLDDWRLLDAVEVDAGAGAGGRASRVRFDFFDDVCAPPEWETITPGATSVREPVWDSPVVLAVAGVAGTAGSAYGASFVRPSSASPAGEPASECADEGVSGSDGSAMATPATPAIHEPMPSATASAPTLPMCLAYPTGVPPDVLMHSKFPAFARVR